MKRKTIVGVAVCVIAVIINIYFSTIVHELLKHNFQGVFSMQWNHCISSIKADHKHFTIFISLQIFAMLGISLLLLNRFGDYTIKMINVTKDIKTPTPSGSKQHGSARWQSRREIFKNFNVARLDKKAPYVSQLIEHGYDDLKFIKKDGEDGCKD